MKIYLRFSFLSLRGENKGETLKNMYKVQGMPISTEEPVSMKLKILTLNCGLQGAIN